MIDMTSMKVLGLIGFRLWFCIGGLLILSGCGLGVRPNPACLRVALSVEVSSLDPQITSSVDAIRIQGALFETLLGMDARDASLYPMAARAWEVDASGRIYTFHLRDDLRWSDGEAIEAEDFVFAFNRLLNPALGAPFSDLYEVLRLPEGNESAEAVPRYASVEAVDPMTLRMVLRYPAAHFPGLLVRPCAAALPRRWIESCGSVVSRTSAWSYLPGCPYSGPYVVESWTVNDRIRLKQNAFHRSRESLVFEGIEFYPMENASIQELAFQSGLLDVTSKVPPERLVKLQGNPILSEQPDLGTFYVAFHTGRPPLDRAELRRGMGRIIRKEVLTQQVRRRGEPTATGFCPPELYHHEPSTFLAQDEIPEFAPGLNRPLRLLIASSDVNQSIAEVLQSMWTEVTGLQVEIQRQEWKSYLDSRNRGDFDLCLASWLGDYADPMAFLEMWQSGAGNNHAKWQSPGFDELLVHARAERDPQLREGWLRRAEEMLMQEAPILPLFHLNRVFLLNPELDSWPQSLLNTIDYTRIIRRPKTID
jgi:oligopeptide transport system substrate-binding protein